MQVKIRFNHNHKNNFILCNYSGNRLYLIRTSYLMDRGFETLQSLHMRLTFLYPLAPSTYKNHLMHTIRCYLP